MRCFIALPLPEKVRSFFDPLLESAKNLEPTWRWATPDSLHITLAFLGEIGNKAIEIAKETVLSTSGFGPIEMIAKQIVTFPEKSRPHVIALELEGENCISIWKNVNSFFVKACHNAGISCPVENWEKSRSFRAHLTLARSTYHSSRPDIQGLWDHFSKAFQSRLVFKECVLYRSDLLPGGAVHLELVRSDITGK